MDALMDVFALRDRLKSEHEQYFESFVQIADDRIRAEVEDALAGGLLWPHPRVGLNPAFEPGGTVDDLVGSERLHTSAGAIFRARKSEQDPVGKLMTLHRHQSDAIDAAAAGRSYVLTTGTGSGKSLAYIVPIVDHVLRAGSGQGIKALVLYPMNALANSQCEELAKFLDYGPAAGDGTPWQQPVSFGLFTGQQGEEERDRLRQNPPDILLTNYVMAEYILTRHLDRGLVRAMSQLRFVVLDELHTYRGRQGADVASRHQGVLRRHRRHGRKPQGPGRAAVQLANLPEHPESVPINNLVRVEGTPLHGAEELSPLELARCIAVARILMPRAVVRLSAGRTDLSEEAQALCFMAGAGSIFCGDQLLTTPNPSFTA